MRKRMICPSIWTNRKFIRLSDKEKILYIGLFSTADDYGKLWYDLLSMKASIFPCDNITEDDIAAALNNLHTLKLIITDQKVIKIHGWKTHQSVPKPQNSNIPEPNINRYANSTEPLQYQFGNDTVTLPDDSGNNTLTVKLSKSNGSAKERNKERNKEKEINENMGFSYSPTEKDKSIEEVKNLLQNNISMFSKDEFNKIEKLIEQGKELSALSLIYNKLDR